MGQHIGKEPAPQFTLPHFPAADIGASQFALGALRSQQATVSPAPPLQPLALVAWQMPESQRRSVSAWAALVPLMVLFVAVVLEPLVPFMPIVAFEELLVVLFVGACASLRGVV